MISIRKNRTVCESAIPIKRKAFLHLSKSQYCDNLKVCPESTARNVLKIGGKEKKNLPKYRIESTGCCSALRVLINFYRLFGFSFSGVTFVDRSTNNRPSSSNDENSENLNQIFQNQIIYLINQNWKAERQSSSIERNDEHENEHDDNNSRTRINRSISELGSKRSPLGRLLIVYNICVIFAYLMPIYLVRSPYFAPMLGIVTGNYSHFGGFSEYFVRIGGENRSIASAAEYAANLKPILRYMITILIVVFFTDGALCFIHNLYAGGRLLRMLAEIFAELPAEPKCRNRASILVMATLVLVIAVKMVGLITFNPAQMRLVFIFKADGEIEDYLIVFRRSLKFAIHFFHLIYLSAYSSLWIFTMIAFVRRINSYREEIENGPELTDIRLMALKTKLDRLREQYERVLECFTLPMIVMLAASTFTIIGSVCFMMIAPDPVYASFIFTMNLFSLVRLAAISWFAERPAIAYHRLLLAAYRTFPDRYWSIRGWKTFIAMRRADAQFDAQFVAQTFTVRQSTIVTCFCFALNYIVILLQTENFGIARNGGNDATIRNQTLD